MANPDEPSCLVAVVVPSLHRPDLTQSCLGFLLSQTAVKSELDIVVVEDAASAGPVLDVELFATHSGASIRQILLPQHAGFAAAANRGIAETSSAYLLLLNNDVELEPGFIKTLSDELERHGNLAFASGKMRQTAERNRLDGAGDALLLGGGVYRLGHGDEDKGFFDQQCPVLSGCGGATLYRTSALHEAGLLDEDFFAYLEDADLALRLHLLGYKGAYVPSAIAFHQGSATLGDPLHPQIVTWITRNQILMLIKNYPGSVLLRCLPRILLFHALWKWALISKGRFVAWARGIVGAIQLLPKMLRKRRSVLSQRKIRSAEFLRLLRDSEDQVRQWHRSTPRNQQSSLLRVYFFFCK